MTDNVDNEDSKVTAGVRRIEELFDAQRYADVVSLANELLAHCPSDYRLFYHRAQANMLAGNLEGAIADMTSAIAQNPDEPTLFYFRGLWRLDGGLPQAAADDLRKAIETELKLGTSYYLESARFARSVALLALGDFRQAEFECAQVRRDMKTFLAGRQWTANEVLACAARGVRPRLA